MSIAIERDIPLDSAKASNGRRGLTTSGVIGNAQSTPKEAEGTRNTFETCVFGSAFCIWSPIMYVLFRACGGSMLLSVEARSQSCYSMWLHRHPSTPLPLYRTTKAMMKEYEHSFTGGTLVCMMTILSR